MLVFIYRTKGFKILPYKRKIFLHSHINYECLYVIKLDSAK